MRQYSAVGLGDSVLRSCSQLTSPSVLSAGGTHQSYMQWSFESSHASSTISPSITRLLSRLSTLSVDFYYVSVTLRMRSTLGIADLLRQWPMTGSCRIDKMEIHYLRGWFYVSNGLAD